jgi:ankyrin repeat protein
MLLQAKASVDMKDNSGQTPLGWAAWNGHTEVVKMLREAGAHNS